MNPVAFTAFGYDIRWYSILLLVGILLSLFFVMREAKRFNIPKDFMFNMAFWVIIIGIIGARLYYCAFNYSYYKDHLMEILYIWEGGLAIHGGIIAGFLTVLFYTKRYNISTVRITDIICVPLLLAQAIGRWGNFFNGEAHGVATTYYHLTSELHLPEFIVKGMKIGNVYYLPTFFFESMLCLLGFLILLIVRRFKYLKKGQLTCFYLMYYSAIRFFIESYRTDSLMIGPFRMAQVISIVLFIVGLLASMILSRKGRFEDLYNSEAKRKIQF